MVIPVWVNGYGLSDSRIETWQMTEEDIEIQSEVLMKKILIVLTVMLMLIFLNACEFEIQKSGENVTETEKETDGSSEKVDGIQTVYRSIGEVENVYTGYRTRFFSGETIVNFQDAGDLVFLAHLVEYRHFTGPFASYVETVTSKSNAAPHQGYNINYVKDRKYAEFCAYIEKSTGKVRYYEIRVFSGDFLSSDSTWNAKTCLFNSSLTRDITNNVDVDFGIILPDVIIPSAMIPQSTVTYDAATGLVSDENNEMRMEILEGSTAVKNQMVAALNELGTVNTIYDNQSALCVAIINNGSIVQMYYFTAAEYTSVKEEYKKLFDDAYNEKNQFDSGCYPHDGFKDLTSLDTTKQYIEIRGDVDLDTGKITKYVLKRIDPETYNTVLTGKQDMSYATEITLTEIPPTAES